MFIGICGSICAGKRTIARYLVDHHGFTQLYVSPRSADGANEADTAVDGFEDLSISQARQHHFSTHADLLDFVTNHWRERWVTTDIPSEAVLDTYARRPFFLLISVDAPITIRWRRFQARQQQQQQQQQQTPLLPPTVTITTTPPPPTPTPPLPTTPPTTPLETFIHLSDTHLFSPLTGAHPLLSRATIRLLNTSPTLAHLYATLGNLNLPDPARLRPSWDCYFMALASLAAQRSNCMKRRVGCVVVRDKRVISTGYNGTPRGMRNCGEGGCGRCNNVGGGSGVGLATCLCIHAEENALLEAGRERIGDGKVVLYCDTCPCLTCSIKIVQVGVGEVVYAQGYSMDGETAAVFREAGVRLRQFVPPANGLIHLEKPELYTQGGI